MASTSSNINEYPNVTLTYAQSIDGSIAGIAGKRLRLSGMESMKYTHELRAANNAILIGVNTLLADNPSLTVRMCPGNSPQPVILDSNLRIPTTCKLLTNEKCIKPIILYCCDTENNDENNKKLNQLNQLGCICIKSKSHDGHVDLDDGLKLIKKKPHDINTLMVEGGGQVITNFMRLHCDQNIGFSIGQVIITIAPTFVGGVKSVQSLLPYIDTSSNKDNTENVKVGEYCFPRLINMTMEMKGTDIIVKGNLDFS